MVTLITQWFVIFFEAKEVCAELINRGELNGIGLPSKVRFPVISHSHPPTLKWSDTTSVNQDHFERFLPRSSFRISDSTVLPLFLTALNLRDILKLS